MEGAIFARMVLIDICVDDNDVDDSHRHYYHQRYVPGGDDDHYLF
jgi:hypothetical protein